MRDARGRDRRPPRRASSSSCSERPTGVATGICAAGGVEEGESEAVAAARELEEETGLRAPVRDLELGARLTTRRKGRVLVGIVRRRGARGLGASAGRGARRVPLVHASLTRSRCSTTPSRASHCERRGTAPGGPGEGRLRHVAARADARRHGAPRARAARRARGRERRSSSTRSRSAAPGRVATVVRDAVWYPSRCRRRRAQARRPPLPDVPRAAARPCAGRRDRPRSRRPAPSRGLPRLDRALRTRRPACGRSRGADARRRASRSSPKREAIELLGVPAERIRVVPNGVEPVFTPDGAAAEGDYVLAVGDARAAQEPRPRASRRRGSRASSCASSAPAAGAASTVRLASGSSSRTRSSRGSTAARAASSTRRSTRASGSRCSRRWPAARPSSRARRRHGGGRRRGGGARRPARSAESIAAGIEEAERAPRRARAAGLARARPFTWAHAADAVEALWRELA